ncbi:hypothetical protein CKM354_000759800 [Cercospora kikuchii]|uniref:F-box domain-containing protein n=1 Tax=Cercospora kikuchii TaxID=84275 RepID=A0A9P3FJ77_9PEZI|nr:uncharacterized protein CKM354_000759800 [Cercospora kikuchii]GIZ44400.1 hypothetical protein CKM354_000759800 [Cercospora kikuchii]
MAGTASKLQVTPTTTNSPLHDLPIELLELILPYLESGDLFNLRLASTELAAKTVQYMAKTYFSWLHVIMLDASGMSRLIWVAKHPVYKSAVKRIELNVTLLKDPEEHEHCPWTRESDRTRDKIAKYRTLYANHMDARSDAQHRLKLVLNLFQLAGNIPVISATFGPYMSPLSPGYPNAWGVEKLFRDHGDQVLVRGDALVDQSAYGALCWAIYESTAEIVHLLYGDWEHHLDPWILGHAMLLYPHRAPFTHLRSLTLLLPLQRRYSGLRGVEMRQNCQMIDFNRTAILTLVSQAERLDYLSLTCEISYDSDGGRQCDDTFFQALVAEKLPTYEKPLRYIAEVELNGHEIPKEMLLSFIREHKATLQSLELEKIVDEDRDDPDIKQDVFAAAQDIVGFKLKMDDVSEGEEYARDKPDLPVWETIESWNLSSYL